MKKLATILLLLANTIALFGAMSQEPVVITKCKSFSARGDDQSKIALASNYRNREESCSNSGDCDDINKVCRNAVLKFEIVENAPTFTLRAFYPDGQNYDYFIKIKAPKNAFNDTAELWASTTANFNRSTYAIAVKDSEKKGFLEIFRLASDENKVAKDILPRLNSADLKKLSAEEKLQTQKVELELVKIFEAMTNLDESGYTSEFVASDDWFDESLRTQKLEILKSKFK